MDREVRLQPDGVVDVVADTEVELEGCVDAVLHRDDQVFEEHLHHVVGTQEGPQAVLVPQKGDRVWVDDQALAALAVVLHPVEVDLELRKRNVVHEDGLEAEDFLLVRKRRRSRSRTRTHLAEDVEVV